MKLPGIALALTFLSLMALSAATSADARALTAPPATPLTN